MRAPSCTRKRLFEKKSLNLKNFDKAGMEFPQGFALTPVVLIFIVRAAENHIYPPVKTQFSHYQSFWNPKPFFKKVLAVGDKKEVQRNFS